MDKNIKTRISNILSDRGLPSLESITYYIDDMEENGFESLEYLLSLGDKAIEQYFWLEYFPTWSFKCISKKTLGSVGPHTKKFFQKGIRFCKQFEIFDEIQTDRLILSKLTKKESKEYAKHLKTDGDSTVYFGSSYSKWISEEHADQILNRMNNYSIKMKNGEMVGIVALDVMDRGIANLSYYIFKENRKKGYCYEACKAVIGEAFAGKFYTVTETIENDKKVLEKNSVEVKTVKARCFTFNEGSNCVLKSLGFTLTGYDYHSRYLDYADECASENLYYLNRE